MKLNKMSKEEKDGFYRNLSTFLLSFVSIFGVLSVVLLININGKLNMVITDLAVEQVKTEANSKAIVENKENIKILEKVKM